MKEQWNDKLKNIPEENAVSILHDPYTDSRYPVDIYIMYMYRNYIFCVCL